MDSPGARDTFKWWEPTGAQPLAMEFLEVPVTTTSGAEFSPYAPRKESRSVSKPSMALADLGISDADLANQYQYTKDIVTDSNGVLKGVSWQGCPGALFYNREAAIEVLGTDDPAEVQKAVADWETFGETAAKMQEAGYSMVSSVNDTYRVYSNNVSSQWVVDGKINIDENLMNWVNDSKEMVDAGQTNTYELWSDDWSKGFYPE